MTDKIKHTNHKGRKHMTKYWSDFLIPQWSRPAVITVSCYDLDDHKNKWNCHRSYLYECDRSSGMHGLKLGIKIANFKQHNWSTELI